MAKKKKVNSCLLGCGVGCLILLIAAIALFAGGAVWLRGTVSGFEEAVEARDAVEEELGEPADFTPAADGAIPAERLESFLAVRAATADGREGIHRFFAALPMSEEEARALENQPFLQRMGSVLGITSSALGLAGKIGDFYKARNTALAEQRMGLGEYSYIYVLAYYSWLGKSPDDGPGDEEEMRGDFGRSYSRVRRTLISQLENQLAAAAGGGAEAEPDAATRTLAAEIAALREDRYRIPWKDGLPPPIEESLRPFRDRLESVYDPVTNPFELARMEQRGNFSFDFD